MIPTIVYIPTLEIVYSGEDAKKQTHTVTYTVNPFIAQDQYYTFCSNCTQKMTESYFCMQCSNPACAKCNKTCQTCGNLVCNKHYFTCPDCKPDSITCVAHKQQCTFQNNDARCSNIYCNKHELTCVLCKRKGCRHHIKTRSISLMKKENYCDECYDAKYGNKK